MEDKRRSILTAARSVLEESGSQFTIDQVAREAGVAKGTVYLYFSSKQDLLLHVLLDGLEQLEQSLAEALVIHQDAKSRLEYMLTAHYEMVIGRTPMFYKLMSHDSNLLKGMGKGFLPRFKAIEQAYAEVLEQGIQEGSFRAMNTEITSAMLLALVNNVAASCRIFRPNLSPHMVLEHVRSLIFQGIGNSPAAAEKFLQED